SGARYGALTTPGPVELHDILDASARRGVTHLAMEASSLGIEQRRLDGVKATLAAFTNFSRDHLDHHPDLEAYFQAKMRLFEALMQPGQTVVVDADSDAAPAPWRPRIRVRPAARGGLSDRQRAGRRGSRHRLGRRADAGLPGAVAA